MTRRRFQYASLALLLAALLAAGSSARAQAGWVLSEQEISEGVGGFGGALDRADTFGMALARLGDLDGDGIGDLAVGAERDDDGGANRGAVWIVFLNADGTVKSEQKISEGVGGFAGALSNADSFGVSAASPGDLDGDGVVDLAVGAWGDDDGGSGRGAVWILFLNADGTVKAEQKISQTAGGLGGTLGDEDTLGVSLAGLGDLDGDGIGDLASGADHCDDGGNERGAVWILFLNANGTVKSEQKISSTEGGFAGPLDDDSYFGLGVAAAGDLDADGTTDLAVGLAGPAGGGSSQGAVWILFLRPDGTVRGAQLISTEDGGFGGSLPASSYFGFAIEALGDHDGDGFGDLAVGAPYDDAGDQDQGSVWVLHLKGCPPASASSRNPDVGGHVNPDVYSVTTPPVLGSSCRASIVTTGMTGSYLVGFAAPLTASTRWGNLLADVADPMGELLGSPLALGDPAVIDVTVPDDPGLCGFFVATQGLRFGAGLDLTNAQDLIVGR